MPPGADDVEYLLDALNTYFGTSIGLGDLTGAYAGVRPLISSGDPKKSVDISRKAELYETSSGMLTITGGKLTTFRRMAAEVVDRIVEREGREAECRTDDIPLGMSARPEDLETSAELPEGATDQLAFRYGHASRAVLDLCEASPELAEPIVPGHPDLMAEVVVAARHEQARSVADVLLRRTRLGLRRRLGASRRRSRPGRRRDPRGRARLESSRDRRGGRGMGPGRRGRGARSRKGRHRLARSPHPGD